MPLSNDAAISHNIRNILNDCKVHTLTHLKMMPLKWMYMETFFRVPLQVLSTQHNQNRGDIQKGHM